MGIQNKQITLSEWGNIRMFLESKCKGASDLYRDYFFHRNGGKGGTGLRNVTMMEALYVAEKVLANMGITIQ